jgi:type IV fimbrial biogenesis protein FimT
MRNRGFTLLEALVVLALLAVLLSLAAPSLQGLRHKHQMQSQAEQLQSSLMLARTEALRRQQRVTLCVRESAAGAGPDCATAGTWAQGWVVFVDGNDNGRREAAETVLQLQEALPGFLTLKGNATVNRYISYGPQGRSQSVTDAFQAGTLTLCGAGQAHVWRVVINAVGKPRLEKADRTDQANC